MKESIVVYWGLKEYQIGDTAFYRDIYTFDRTEIMQEHSRLDIDINTVKMLYKNHSDINLLAKACHTAQVYADQLVSTGLLAKMGYRS